MVSAGQYSQMVLVVSDRSLAKGVIRRDLNLKFSRPIPLPVEFGVPQGYSLCRPTRVRPLPVVCTADLLL
jgi:hypothetical protein